MARQAMFAGLVYDENENVVATAVVGPEAFYVIDDNGFKRHIDAEEVDRQVLSFFLEQLEDNKDLAVEQMLNMMGKDDLFTKAAVDASLRNVNMDEIIAQGVPEQILALATAPPEVQPQVQQFLDELDDSGTP